MKRRTALHTFSICLLLGITAGTNNDHPCQHTRNNNGHSNFVHRHLRSGIPLTLDKNAWQKYLRENRECSRPTQSFLHVKDQGKVDAVCSENGGKIYRNNLCISNSAFNFITVRSDSETCSVTSVRNETKHLILACDLQGNHCLPVHFEGNPKGEIPNNNAPACKNQPTGRGTSHTVTILHMLSVLTISMMVFIL